MKQTPFHSIHRQLGAKMVPFGGYEMPVQYTSIIEEHRAVRTAVGVFDVSHMGEFVVKGERAGILAVRDGERRREAHPGRSSILGDVL